MEHTEQHEEDQSQSGKVECWVCGKYFPNKSMFEDHFIQVHASLCPTTRVIREDQIKFKIEETDNNWPDKILLVKVKEEHKETKSQFQNEIIK